MPWLALANTLIVPQAEWEIETFPKGKMQGFFYRGSSKRYPVFILICIKDTTDSERLEHWRRFNESSAKYLRKIDSSATRQIYARYTPLLQPYAFFAICGDVSVDVGATSEEISLGAWYFDMPSIWASVQRLIPACAVRSDGAQAQK
jgi:hypothetical protein